MQKRFSRWLYRLQQRLSLTRNESWALLMLTGLALTGLTVLFVRQSGYGPPPDAQRETERRFADMLAADPPTASPEALDEHVGAGHVETDPAETERAVRAQAPGEAASGRAEAAPRAGGGRLDLNAATRAELEALPHIGPVLAGRILDHRAAHGPFGRVEELTRVSGIGAKTLEELRPLVVVHVP